MPQTIVYRTEAIIQYLTAAAVAMRRIVCIMYILPPLAVSMLLSGDSHCGSSCGGGGGEAGGGSGGGSGGRLFEERDSGRAEK